jgi:hypothetical protein
MSDAAMTPMKVLMLVAFYGHVSMGSMHHLQPHLKRGLHVCICTADVPGSPRQGGTATAMRLLATTLANDRKLVAKVTLLAVTGDMNE